jgi:hypothetical protein
VPYKDPEVGKRRAKERRARNKEKLAAYNREYRQKNKEKLAAQNREYRARNKEKLAAYNREYQPEYNKRPYVIARRREINKKFNSSDRGRQRKIKYRSKPEVREYELAQSREYRSRQDIKARDKEYRKRTRALNLDKVREHDRMKAEKRRENPQVRNYNSLYGKAYRRIRTVREKEERRWANRTKWGKLQHQDELQDKWRKAMKKYRLDCYG